MESAPTPRDGFAILVHTLVFRAGKVLLLRRANTGVMDGRYTLPGGHRQRGETVAGAAARECEEEAAVEVLRIRAVAALPYLDGVNFVFEAVEWRGTPAIAEPDKCDALAFAPPNALPAPTAPFVATALRCRAEGLWYREGKAETALAPTLLPAVRADAGAGCSTIRATRRTEAK